MEEKIRKTGIDILGDAPWGTHFCQFYQTKEDLVETLVPYFRAGLENNEFCTWITSEPLGVDDAKRSLKREVKNLDYYFEKGQIEILDYSQWYTKSGKFESDKVLHGWVEKEEQAIKKGFDGLRFTGNTFWLEKKDWRNFSEYEETINNRIGQHKTIAICTYSLDKCGTSDIIDVINNHKFALIMKEGKWIIIENIERKRAEKALKTHEQYREFTAHLELVREEEKKLLAREIHDELAQVLVALKMDLSWVKRKLPKNQKLLIEKIHSMTKLMDNTIHKAQKMYTELRPSILNHLGLGSAIEWQAEEFQEQIGIRCDVTIVPREIILDWERSTVVFRIFQKTLANVAQHADATRVKIKLSVKDCKLELVVNDNGKGITEEQQSDPKSYGIVEIKERARFLMGEVKIKGIPGKGTTLTVTIPLKTENQD